MVNRSPNPVDVHVGIRLRMRRMMVGMSQERLGEQLGLTFQQVQKYEKGLNRVSASKLFQISRILEVPVQYFFDDMSTGTSDETGGFSESAGEPMIMDYMSSPEAMKLCRALSGIRSVAVRRKLVELANVLAELDD